jgi:hypothetical protein
MEMFFISDLANVGTIVAEGIAKKSGVALGSGVVLDSGVGVKVTMDKLVAVTEWEAGISGILDVVTWVSVDIGFMDVMVPTVSDAEVWALLGSISRIPHNIIEPITIK